jgi:hypothetical protein
MRCGDKGNKLKHQMRVPPAGEQDTGANKHAHQAGCLARQRLGSRGEPSEYCAAHRHQAEWIRICWNNIKSSVPRSDGLIACPCFVRHGTADRTSCARGTGRCSVRISGLDTRYLVWRSSYFSSFSPGKCRDSASISPQQVPSKRFLIHHLSYQSTIRRYTECPTNKCRKLEGEYYGPKQ